MFEIPVWDLLASYSWDSKELEFSWEVYAWYYDDLIFLKNLELRIKIIWLDDRVTVIIEKLKTQVKYWDKICFINIENVDREFKMNKEDTDPDDIGLIKDYAIDLKDAIREEILIKCID